jgi:RNA-directed DNA polymerase
VLEPIFEADFEPCSYGFRPKRRAQDAIAEIHYLGSTPRDYHWVFEGDINACFDEIDHTALMGRVRRRVGDKRVLGLITVFLKAGILTEDGRRRGTLTGTRAKRRRAGEPVMKLIRYADDFVIMLHGTRADADALWDEVAVVLAPMGLRLSTEKTRVCHIDEGFDFLGWHIQRRNRRGRTGKKAVYTYPSKKALNAIIDKVRTLTRRGRHRTLADLLRRLNPTLRGWCNYFRHGVSKRTFSISTTTPFGGWWAGSANATSV